VKHHAQALKGHLGVLLAALETGPRHGYAIKEALREGPALHRLEDAGLIRGTWSVVDGRRRRTYQLTAAARRRLNTDRDTWREFGTWPMPSACGPQAVSDQLQRLADRGIVAARRDDNNIFYRIADPCVNALLDLGCA
jgi:DNA-binding transcriptional ArsR family regulator